MKCYCVPMYLDWKEMHGSMFLGQVTAPNPPFLFSCIMLCMYDAVGLRIIFCILNTVRNRTVDELS